MSIGPHQILQKCWFTDLLGSVQGISNLQNNKYSVMKTMQCSSYSFKANIPIRKMWTQGVKNTDSQVLGSRGYKYAGSTSIYLNTFILVEQACYDRKKHHKWYF